MWQLKFAASLLSRIINIFLYRTLLKTNYDVNIKIYVIDSVMYLGTVLVFLIVLRLKYKINNY